MTMQAPTDVPIHPLLAARWSPYAFADRPPAAQTGAGISLQRSLGRDLAAGRVRGIAQKQRNARTGCGSGFAVSGRAAVADWENQNQCGVQASVILPSWHPSLGRTRWKSWLGIRLKAQKTKEYSTVTGVFRYLRKGLWRPGKNYPGDPHAQTSHRRRKEQL